MRFLRLQLFLTAFVLALIGWLLYGQAQGIRTRLVPAAGGIYTEGVVGYPQQLNPLLPTTQQAERDLNHLLYRGLLRTDSDGFPVPDLAKSWAVSADALSYSFELRSDVRWHDGQPLTIDDVLFTIGLLQNPNFPGDPVLGSIWQQVVAKKLSATTLKLTLPKPYAPFLDFLTFAILPAHRFGDITGGDISQLASHPSNWLAIGTGAYQLESFTQQDGKIIDALLQANPNYSEGMAAISKVHLLFFADEASALSAYQNGQIQGLGGLSTTAHRMLAKDPKTKLFLAQRPSYSAILFNFRNTDLVFFQSARVRQALLEAINRPALINQFLDGYAVIANSPILPNTWAYDDNLLTTPFDPAQAVHLLDDAGWRLPETALPGMADYVRQKDGLQLAFTLVVPDLPMQKAIAEQISAGWQELGIKATLQFEAPAVLLQEYIQKKNFQAAWVDFKFSTFVDPDPYPFWHQTQIENGQNYSGYVDRRTSETLEQARITASVADRKLFYRSFQQRFQNETPALLLYYPIYAYAIQDRVQNVSAGAIFDPSDRFRTITDWYMVTRRVVDNTPAP